MPEDPRVQRETLPDRGARPSGHEELGGHSIHLWKLREGFRKQAGSRGAGRRKPSTVRETKGVQDGWSRNREGDAVKGTQEVNGPDHKSTLEQPLDLRVLRVQLCLIFLKCHTSMYLLKP